MKKAIAFIISLSLAASLSVTATALVAKKKTTVKKPAKKIVKPVKKTVEKPIVKPVTAPVPVVIPNPEPQIQAAPEKQRTKIREGTGILLGINTGYDAGLFGVSGNLDYDLSNYGLTGLKIRAGGNYVGGVNTDAGPSLMKAVSLKLGALFNITDFLMGPGSPLTFYVGGAYLFPIKVNNGNSGKWGVEGYLGANYSVADFATVNFEAGYATLKYAENIVALKGMDLKLGVSTAF